MKKFRYLRENYPKFIYESYSYRVSKNSLEIFFSFRILPNIRFSPKIIIRNIDRNRILKIDKALLNNLIFHLGIMEIPSYWKATCSPEIDIRAGHLSQEQIKWWKDLIIKGMGQFFYENKINFLGSNFLNLKTAAKRRVFSKNHLSPSVKEQILVPVGGGKDSIVTLEILKKDKKNIRCFSLNSTNAAKKTIKITGCKNQINVERKIDPHLLKLNRQGFLNGHTPFSAFLAFLAILISVLFGQKYIAFSNERSSNEGNLKYLGKNINHQWSKSFEFEKKFRKYLKKYLVKNIEYFSFLRPLYEIQIANLFSRYPQYFFTFLSCNEVYKTNSGIKKSARKWCCNCPKCLFVFTILYPFVEERKLIKIFGENLFEKESLLPIMKELIGERRFKPFECVGTKKESLVAFYLSYLKYIGKKCRDNAHIALPSLLKYFQNKILPKYPRLEKEPKKILADWNNQNNLPKYLEKILSHASCAIRTQD